MTITEDRPTTTLRGSNDPLVPVFVYGTLRVGQYNYDWARSAVVETIENCTTKGNLYFVHPSGGYPVAKLDEEGEIKGDVLWFDPSHPVYDSVVNMELGAGYETREIEVRTESETIEAVAFHFAYVPRGEQIPEGDWVKASEAFEDDDD